MCRFALKNGLRIAQLKCPDDIVLWTRLQDCNITRHVLATHKIDILIVIWRLREIIQFRIARHVVLPQKPVVINSVHNSTSRDEIAQYRFVPVSSPFLDKNWAVFSAKNMTKFLFERTLMFSIDIFTYWTIKLCKKNSLHMHFKQLLS